MAIELRFTDQKSPFSSKNFPRALPLHPAGGCSPRPPPQLASLARAGHVTSAPSGPEVWRSPCSAAYYLQNDYIISPLSDFICFSR